MDPTPIVDAVVQVVQANPRTAGFLALVPFLQIGAAVGAKLTKREHPTLLNRALAWFAAFPIRIR